MMSGTQELPMDQSGVGRETGTQYRDPSQAPLRKLTVDLIKTYRSINDVSVCAIRNVDGLSHGLSFYVRCTMLRKSVPIMVRIKEHLKRTRRLKTGMTTAMITRSTVEKCGKTDTKLTLSLERGHLDRYVDASEWVCWVRCSVGWVEYVESAVWFTQCLYSN